NARVKAMRAWPYPAIGANSCRSDLRLNKNRANECEPMSDHKEMAMRAITLAAVLALLMGPTVAQQQTYRNERGQITGTASTSGSITTYRDAQGRLPAPPSGNTMAACSIVTLWAASRWWESSA